MRGIAPVASILLMGAFAAPQAPAVVLDAVTVRAVSGQSYDGFIVNPNDTHAFLLEDFAPQTFSLSLKAAKGSALLPDISLRDPANAVVTASLAPYRKDGARSVAVRNAPFPSGAGLYTLRVTGKTGSTGEYLLKVSAKVVRAFKGTGIVPGSTDIAALAPAFFVPTEALASLKVVHGSGSTIVPKYTGVAGTACVETVLVPGLKAGTATFLSPASGTLTVSITGDGGTAGTFNWTAKVKPQKVPRKPVRVNGGASFFPDPGPAGGAKVTSSSQAVFGFATDGIDLCWREVRTQGGGPNLGKNTVSCTTVKGLSPRDLAKNIASDPAPQTHTFALGRDAVAVIVNYELFAIPRGPGNALSLNPSIGDIYRVLADDTWAYALRTSGIFRYALDQSDAAGVITDPAYSYLDMAFGASGIVFAAVNLGGDLEIRTVGRDGSGPLTLATLSPNPGFHAIAARGSDAYFAVDDGSGGSRLYRAPACSPGTYYPIARITSGPVRAMAADDLAVFALAEDVFEGIHLNQVPRGGGEATVILRGNPLGGFTLSPSDLSAAGGFVYLLADDGSPSFYKVKRR